MTSALTYPVAEQSLEQSHEAWLAAVRTAMAPVSVPGSGIWERWAAVKFLERQFLPRLERELAPVNRLMERLPAREAARIWMPAELLGFVHAHMIDLVRLAQSGAPFAVAAQKLTKALECWCRETETMVRRVRAAPMSPDVQAALQSLEMAAGNGAPVGVPWARTASSS